MVIEYLRIEQLVSDKHSDCYDWIADYEPFISLTKRVNDNFENVIMIDHLLVNDETEPSNVNLF